MTPGHIFLDFSARKLEQQAARIAFCLARLPEASLWSSPDRNLNSPGNLVLHLCGNVRQWILAGVGGQPDVRQRDAEFAADGAASLPEILHNTVAEVCGFIRALPEQRLAESVTVQGYRVTVLEAVFHVVEHFSGHAGQIFLLTKQATGQPLDFYAHLGSDHEERTP